MNKYPDYCPDDLDPNKDCPACGEPPNGICKAKHNRPRHKPLVEIVLTDKKTGEII